MAEKKYYTLLCLSEFKRVKTSLVRKKSRKIKLEFKFHEKELFHCQLSTTACHALISAWIVPGHAEL